MKTISAIRSSVAEILLPTNKDALKVLSNDPKEKEHQVYEVNKLYVNVWHEGERLIGTLATSHP